MVFDRSVVIESNSALRREVFGSNTTLRSNTIVVRVLNTNIQTPAQKQSNIVKCHILFAKRICHLEDDMPLRGLVRQLQLHLVTVATLL